MAEGGADYDALMKKMDKLQTAIDAIEGWELDRQLERAMQALRCPPGRRIRFSAYPIHPLHPSPSLLRALVPCLALIGWQKVLAVSLPFLVPPPPPPPRPPCPFPLPPEPPPPPPTARAYGTHQPMSATRLQELYDDGCPTVSYAEGVVSIWLLKAVSQVTQVVLGIRCCCLDGTTVATLPSGSLRTLQAPLQRIE